jgi:NAD(P)-dependent dehydrogenase (short-subunit alcohol dehydrogenase family)
MSTPQLPPAAPPIRLDGKVALVTGASRGIGASIARTFAAAGARVVLASRKLEGLEGVRSAILEDGGEARAIACHTGQPESIEAAVDEAVETYGQVDVLVNNAATNPYFGPFIDVEWPAWDKTFDVNVKGYFHATRVVARHLLAREAAGSIVNVSSILGTMGGQLQGVYAMTKAAVVSMTKTFAIELGAAGIRVNAIAPGFIETKFSSAITSSPELTEGVIARTPAGRIGQPQEVAGLALYLASDAASFATGHTYYVDGGMCAG